MKTRYYNAIVFIAVLALVVAVWCNKTYRKEVGTALSSLFGEQDIKQSIDGVDVATKNLPQKDIYINLHSAVQLVMGIHKVEKDDATVVRMDNGYLAYEPNPVEESQLKTMTQQTLLLKETTAQLQIPLLYVMAPRKESFAGFPADVPNTYREDCDRLLAMLEESGIQTLCLQERMEQQGITQEDAYFVTDHHWKPETGLWATGEICQELATRWGFSYDAALLAQENYNKQVYEDWFLGSQGKKVGLWFTPYGADDISLITPNFQTDFTVTVGAWVRSGDFSESLLHMKYMETKDYYSTNPYATYSGGDFGLQIIENHLADPSAKKILVIRDSYACVVTPFLAMNAKSVHIMDLRHWEGDGEVSSVVEYIQREKPDYVVILYGGLQPEMHNFK